MKSINCTLLLVFLLGLIGYTKETFDVDFDRKQDESPKFKLKGSWRVENQEQQVERLIRELQDTDSDVRSIAAVTLGEIGPEAEDAVPILIKLLQDQDAEGFVRANAATALGKIGEGASKAVPALINALRDQDKYVRKDAAEALEKIGTPRTIKTVKDRYRVVIPLGWIGSEDEVPALIQALQNKDKDVRVNAIVTLGQIESEDVVPVLIDALQDQDGWVRVNAAWTLGQRGESASKAVPILIKALRDQDEWVRYHAAMALGEIGESASKAVPALVNALQDQDKYVRRYATGALGKIGKATVPALIQTLKDESINAPLFATWTFGTLRLIAVIGLIGVSGALIITIWFGIVMWKHIVLRIEMGSEKGYHSAVKEDYSEYLGQTGVALTALRPTGAAMINNKRLDVISVENFIDIDTPIQVVGVNGTKVAIEKSRQQTD